MTTMEAKTFCCFLLFLLPVVTLSTKTDTCEFGEENCRQYEFSTMEELKEKLLNDKELVEYLSKQLENNMEVNINTAVTQDTSETNLKKNGFHKEYNGLWYKYFEEKEKFDVAVCKCKQYEGRLISTGYRDFTIREPLLQTTGGGNTNSFSRFWIGLRRDDTNTSLWNWSDGIQTTNTANIWMTGEPNNDGDGEFCGMNKPSESGDESVNDASCNAKLAYFCEVEIK
ncbi:C-type lectin-like [Styela clava]